MSNQQPADTKRNGPMLWYVLGAAAILVACLGAWLVLYPPYSPDNVVLSDAVKRVLDEATTYEVLSVDPNIPVDEAPAVPPVTTLHGYPLLGSVAVHDADLGRRLVESVYRGIATCDQDYGAACFDPRHVLRARRGDDVVELLICFECDKVAAFLNGAEHGGANLNDHPKPLYDRVLRNAGVPIAP